MGAVCRTRRVPRPLALRVHARGPLHAICQGLGLALAAGSADARFSDAVLAHVDLGLDLDGTDFDGSRAAVVRPALFGQPRGRRPAGSCRYCAAAAPAGAFRLRRDRRSRLAGRGDCDLVAGVRRRRRWSRAAAARIGGGSSRERPHALAKPQGRWPMVSAAPRPSSSSLSLFIPPIALIAAIALAVVDDRPPPPRRREVRGPAVAEVSPERKLVLVVVDSLHPENLDRAIASGAAPTFAALVERGTLIRDCVSSFPSVTPVCTSEIATGVGPDRHWIPGMNWYHRDRASATSSTAPRSRRPAPSGSSGPLRHRLQPQHGPPLARGGDRSSSASATRACAAPAPRS